MEGLLGQKKTGVFVIFKWDGLVHGLGVYGWAVGRLGLDWIVFVYLGSIWFR